MILANLVHLIVALFVAHGAHNVHHDRAVAHPDAWIATRHYLVAICRTNIAHGVQHCSASVLR